MIVELKKTVTALGESSSTTDSFNVRIIFTEGSEQVFKLLNDAIKSLADYVLSYFDLEKEQER